MHATFPGRASLRALPKSYKLGGVSSTPIFDHLGAASWHRGDAAAIKAVGKVVEWVLAPWKLVVIGAGVVTVIVWLVRRRTRNGKRRSGDEEMGEVRVGGVFAREEEDSLLDGRGRSRTPRSLDTFSDDDTLFIEDYSSSKLENAV